LPRVLANGLSKPEYDGAASRPIMRSFIFDTVTDTSVRGGVMPLRSVISSIFCAAKERFLLRRLPFSA
jgi:hypothetical protein